MTFKLGNTSINKLFLGATEIKRAYLGATEIFDSTGLGTPAGTPYGEEQAQRAFSVAPYYLWDAPWGAAGNGLTTADYENIIYATGTFPAGTTITWDWPDVFATSPGVYGFIQVGYSNYDGAGALGVTPVQISQLGDFIVDLEWSKRSGNDNYWNLLAEFYPCSVAGDPATKLAEIGWFLHVNDGAANYLLAGTQLGTYNDGIRNWTVGMDPNAPHGDFIMFMASDQSDVEAPIDVKAALEWLRTSATPTRDYSNAYVNGFAVGSEPNRGSGSFVIDAFNVTLTEAAAPPPLVSIPTGKTNLVTSQDISTYYVMSNATASDAETLRATATTTTHGVYKNNIARTAGVKNYRGQLDFRPDPALTGYSTLRFEIRSIYFGGQFVFQSYDSSDLSIGNLSNTTWTLNTADLTGGRSIEDLGDGWFRIAVDFVSDASSNGLTVALGFQENTATMSYLGETDRGVKVKNVWIFDKDE